MSIIPAFGLCPDSCILPLQAHIRVGARTRARSVCGVMSADAERSPAGAGTNKAEGRYQFTSAFNYLLLFYFLLGLGGAPSL